MLTRRPIATRYDVTVRNRPGELARVTELLAKAGVEVLHLAVASVGDVAEIRFTTHHDPGLVDRLRSRGLEARAVPA